MEFTNEIFFNKPLKANNSVIITYSGKLYREHSKDVSIVYGYGDNWEYTESTPMKEIENGFEVTLTMKDYNTFNFCFNNSFNIWDNNSGFNYIASIAPKDDNEPNIDIEDKFTNDGINNDIEECSSINIKDESNDEENTKNIESENFDKAFSALIDSIIDNSSNNSQTNISNLSELVDDIKQKEFNCDKIFDQFFKELTSETISKNETNISVQTDSSENDVSDKTDSSENNVSDKTDSSENDASDKTDSSENDVSDQTDSSENDVSDQTDSSENDVSNQADSSENDVSDQANSSENDASDQADSSEVDIPEANIIEQENKKSENFNNLDNLINDLIESISIKNNEKKEETLKEISNPIKEAKINNNEFELVDLPAIIEKPEEDWLDKIINVSFTVTKKITSACKKLGNLIKLKAKEYGLIGNEK